MFVDEQVAVRVSSIGGVRGFDQSMNQQLRHRKSNSYLVATFNSMQKASFQSSMNRVSRQTKTFVVEEQQEEENKADIDEEAESMIFDKAHEIVFENTAS